MKPIVCSAALLALLSAPTLFGQYSTATRPACGKFATVQFNDGFYSCERWAVFPWYAAGQSWQSQISMFVAPLATGGNGQPRGAGVDIGPGPNGTNRFLSGGAFGSYALIQGDDFEVVASSSSVRLDIVDSAACLTPSTCFLDGGLALGPLWISIDAPDVQTLEATQIQLIYLYRDANGVLSRQVAVPPVFQDQATAKWVSSFSETPVNVAAGVNANFMAFAVTNLSKQPQAVSVQFYDQNGILVAEKNTPILAAGQGGDQFFADSQYAGQVIPGGVYAANVKDFFAFTSTQFSGITAATLAKTGTIDGTIMFRGLNGGAIAPLVVRTVGASLTLLLQTPLP